VSTFDLAAAGGGRRRHSHRALRVGLCALTLGCAAARADDAGAVAAPPPALTEEAWWTGSLLSASAATMPPGRWLIEPFVVDAITTGEYDAAGTRERAPREQEVGAAAYLMYGLIDGLSVGLLPHLALYREDSAAGSSGLALGDVTLISQLRLTAPDAARGIPATSLLLEETLPSGRYERLAGGADAASGAGAYTTQVAFYAQTLLHLHHRPLRLRLNLTYALSARVALEDVSVYGTPSGFRGSAHPGASLTAVTALEYSLTRHWVLACDGVYQRAGNTRVTGTVPTAGTGSALLPYQSDTGTGQAVSVAPALEYNFNAEIGVIAGANVSVWGRRSAAAVVPAVAVNMYF
jgi:hypothetical protein